MTRPRNTQYDKEYYLKNKATIQEYQKEWKLKNKEKLKAQNKTWAITHPYSERSKQSHLLSAARQRAKNKKLDFNIEKEDIVIPTHCPFLGIPLVNTRPYRTSRSDIASLDRIDPTKGYTKDNIEVISHLANTMKSNATKEQLILFAKEVLKRYV
jgi:hypothetical protein